MSYVSRQPIALVAFTPPINAEQLTAAQKQDVTLSLVYEFVDNKSTPPNTGKWS